MLVAQSLISPRGAFVATKPTSAPPSPVDPQQRNRQKNILDEPTHCLYSIV
jgi:hypothetical protein